MESEILVDTSALIAFFIQSETHHPRAKRYFLQQSSETWVIFSTVFDETVTWMRTRVSPLALVQVGQILRAKHRYVLLSEEDDRETWALFCKYSDKTWSYTDCSLLAMSQRLGIGTIASFDRHIQQMAGLGILGMPN